MQEHVERKTQALKELTRRRLPLVLVGLIGLAPSILVCTLGGKQSRREL
jgi:hypothetical protein